MQKFYPSIAPLIWTDCRDILAVSDGRGWAAGLSGRDKVTGVDFYFLCPLYFFPHSFSSSYFLPLFHCLISSLLFPCSSVWENLIHEFPIFYNHTDLLLNGTCSLRAPMPLCGDVPAIKQLNYKQTWRDRAAFGQML